MKIPENVLWFEILLYLSLMLDALSIPFRSDTFAEIGDEMLPIAKLTTAFLIALFAFLVWYAARTRKNWPRWVLLASVILSALQVAAAMNDLGFQASTVVDIVSTALTAGGLYLSFTGDAKDWFRY